MYVCMYACMLRYSSDECVCGPAKPLMCLKLMENMPVKLGASEYNAVTTHEELVCFCCPNYMVHTMESGHFLRQ